MTADEYAIKITPRVEYMITQVIPRPSCPTKQRAHAELIRQVKAKIAERLAPENNGLNITIDVVS